MRKNVNLVQAKTGKLNPVINKETLEYVEFYITNACNFNCSSCNRFNNWAFKGHQSWSDYAETYAKWSEILEFDRICIIGGEPMVNPNCIDWITGIRQLWPNAVLDVVTNGSLNKKFNKKLYDCLVENKCGLQIGLHNVDRLQEVLAMVYSFMHPPLDIQRFPKNIERIPGVAQSFVRSYNAIKDISWPNINCIDDWKNIPENIKQECENVHNFSPEIIAEDRQGYCIVDANGLKIEVEHQNFFHQSALKVLPYVNSFTFHNSDPMLAHEICDSKTCHNFVKGKLYKCGQVALFSEVLEQFNVVISNEDRQLIESYQPLSVDEDQKNIQRWISNLHNPMQQCKFCPQEFHNTEIFASASKSKFGIKK